MTSLLLSYKLFGMDVYSSHVLPAAANYVRQGTGAPVIMIHGLAASLHDWDDLIPEVAAGGYACYALDLLGHGDSPRLDEGAYQMDWIFEHFFNWVGSLHLSEPAVLIGHSLGGHIALEYARRAAPLTRSLVLVNPFYSPLQLPLLLREAYRRLRLSRVAARRVPEALFRFLVDMSSLAMGHGIGAVHSLPDRIRAQTVLDYKRTAPGVYHIPNVIPDLTPHLHEIDVPTLVLWGEHDQTLLPTSFARLVEALPQARGVALRAGHVPHQSHVAAFNPLVVRFLRKIEG